MVLRKAYAPGSLGGGSGNEMGKDELYGANAKRAGGGGPGHGAGGGVDRVRRHFRTEVPLRPRGPWNGKAAEGCGSKAVPDGTFAMVIPWQEGIGLGITAFLARLLLWNLGKLNASYPLNGNCARNGKLSAGGQGVGGQTPPTGKLAFLSEVGAVGGGRGSRRGGSADSGFSSIKQSTHQTTDDQFGMQSVQPKSANPPTADLQINEASLQTTVEPFNELIQYVQPHLASAPSAGCGIRFIIKLVYSPKVGCRRQSVALACICVPLSLTSVTVSKAPLESLEFQ